MSLRDSLRSPLTWLSVTSTAASTTRVRDIEPLLEWADRDEQDCGLREAPYPSNFPK